MSRGATTAYPAEGQTSRDKRVYGWGNHSIGLPRIQRIGGRP
jgi:hypothetical protein